MNADPIADMLTRIRNANALRYDEVSMASSKQKVAIAEILKKEGFISDFRVEEEEGKKNLFINLKYSATGERVISGLKRISKPGSASTRKPIRSRASSAGSASRC